MEKNHFHAELDNYDLHLPGRNVVSFDNNEALKNFMCHQYPEWRACGQVTSIPAARVPRLFLTGDQMTESLERRFRSLQKGESGEIEVYKLLLETSKDLHDGILVLPNVDGNHFKSKEAHVEIDAVVIHPKKGVFVLNVKNAICINEKQLVQDMMKHTQFICLLRDYNDDTKTVKVPIHGIICSLQKEVMIPALETCGYWSSANDTGQRYVFQPNDMTDFSAKWGSLLSGAPNIDSNPDIDVAHFDVLAARLAALNSMEGAVAFVHNKITSGEVQKIYNEPSKSRDILQDNLNQAYSDNQLISDKDLCQLKEHLVELQLGIDLQDVPQTARKKKCWYNFT